MSTNVNLVIAYLPHRRRVRQYLKHRLRGVHFQELADVEQELFTRLLRSKQLVADLREPISYFFTSAAHVVADHVLAHNRFTAKGMTVSIEGMEDTIDERVDEAFPDVADLLSNASEIEFILGHLPDAQRACLLLHHRDGYKISEIAEMLKMPYLTVDKYIARAKKKGRELIERRVKCI